MKVITVNAPAAVAAAQEQVWKGYEIIVLPSEGFSVKKILETIAEQRGNGVVIYTIPPIVPCSKVKEPFVVVRGVDGGLVVNPVLFGFSPKQAKTILNTAERLGLDLNNPLDQTVAFLSAGANIKVNGVNLTHVKEYNGLVGVNCGTDDVLKWISSARLDVGDVVS